MIDTKDGTKPAERSAPTCQMMELYDDLRRMQRHTKGRHAVLLRYSVLNRLFQQPYQRRLIATAFNIFVHSGDIHLYWRSNFDLYVVQVGKNSVNFEALITKAQRAVEDDDFVKSLKGDIKDKALYRWYDLEEDMPAFLSEIHEICDKSKEPKNMFAPLNKAFSNDARAVKDMKIGRESSPVPFSAQQDRKPQAALKYISISTNSVKKYMGPIQLDQLERNLENIDILGMIKDQNICVILPNVAPQIIFTEKYISVEKLSRKLLPDYNLAGDTWLFQRLTETFDRKLLTSGFEKYIGQDQVVSINCNVSSVMSRNFDHFITKYKMNHSTPLILEFRLFDILAHIGKYFEMREKLKKLGCRVCIEFMDIKAIGVIDRNITNVDFIKIPWNKQDKQIMSSALGAEIKMNIDAQDKMRIIMIHCDSLEAIRFGQSLGIKIFQGFYVDKLIR
jgi:hypothetical protein